jgi:hypothetical protein
MIDHRQRQPNHHGYHSKPQSILLPNVLCPFQARLLVPAGSIPRVLLRAE